MRCPVVLVCCLVACGGSSEEDEVLERELAAEESAGDSEETELTIADRHRAAETRVFEACYDELAHLDDSHRERRELRVRLLSEAEVSGEAPARIAVERESDSAGATSDELPSNVDDETHAYNEDERAVIAAENELDLFHGAHPNHDEWTDADLAAYEDIADRLVALCLAMHASR